MKIAATIIASTCLVFFSSCATPVPVRPPLPAAVPLENGAGHGDFVLLPLHLENRKDLLFIVDTGAPDSLFDQSLEPILGKRVGRQRIKSMYGTEKHNLYREPRLYLGDTLLQTGDKIDTFDFQKLSTDFDRIAHFKHRIMGVLGMDCLRHYRIQLDFANKQMRFLDPDHLGNPASLGQAFPIIYSHFNHHLYVRDDDTKGMRAKWLIDTGCNFNGTMPRKYADNQLNASSNSLSDKYCLADAVCGMRYTNLYFREGRFMLGLGFFARNQVTFDFPDRVMYLKPASAEPSPGAKSPNADTPTSKSR
jgi:hypothetical protein